MYAATTIDIPKAYVCRLIQVDEGGEVDRTRRTTEAGNITDKSPLVGRSIAFVLSAPAYVYSRSVMGHVIDVPPLRR
jgi:hypothetical protein